MFKSGIANLPLHGGSCPRWLFPIMKKLGGAISGALIYEYGQQEFLKRLADPYWLQSFGSVIGFDWHSSGLTTTTLGALKESINNQNLGIKIAGGKGNESKKVLEEIENSVFNLSENKVEKLKYSSRMSAKVDNCLMQDGYQLYHHSFVFDEKGNWVVVQQGMNSENKYARRYHWLSGTVSDFVEEPHNAICCDSRNNSTLDLTSRDNYKVKKISVDLVNDDINNLNKYFNIRIRSDKNNSIQKTIYEFDENAKNQTKIFTMAPKHTIIYMDKRNIETLKKAHEFQPQNYEELVSIKGIGAKTIRSLALVSELIYGTEINWKDPVKYSFAHGGKDGIPYPVDRKLMDDNTEILRNAIKDAKLGNKEKLSAIGRLGRLYVS
ncbi:MAG TPA: DUF763 domain-containing protein [Candidatus Nanoarchaeia archaeon]|nr:DUF763 domain-containing protein [Candidatus Nanoarchaeia archaeon]